MVTAMMERLGSLTAPNSYESGREARGGVFWVPGRIRHNLSHWLCELAAVPPITPGVCMNDPYNDDQKPKSRVGNKFEDAVAAKADLTRSWKQLTGMYRRAVRGIIAVGPRERLESDDEWYDRRLIWWITHRYEFGNLPAETLLNLAEEASNRMAYILNHPEFPPIPNKPIDK